MRIPLTIPHWYDFGPDRDVVGRDLGRAEAWDALRTGTDGAFALPSSPAALATAARRQPELEGRARAVGEWLSQIGARSVASYGAGAGLLEWWLSNDPAVGRLLVTEYAPATVERLRSLLPRTEVSCHDLLAEPPLDADAHLFHRIDTEFSAGQWRAVLARFAAQRVLFVAAGVTGPRDALAELLRRVRHPGATRAGWLRNRTALDALWRSTHHARPLPVADLPAWALEPRLR